MRLNKAVFVGLMGSVSIVFGIMENLIPMPIPAVRLGLSNIPIMIMLYLGGVSLSFILLLLKSFLVPLFSGNFIFKLSLGLPSTLVAFISMLIIFQFCGAKDINKYDNNKEFLKNIILPISSPISIGIVGAIFHMYTQLFIADKLYIYGILNTKISWILMLIATLTGIFTGILTDRLISRASIKRLFNFSSKILIKT